MLTELPLPRPSIGNKIDGVVACLPIESMAPFVAAPAAYPYNSGKCNDYAAEKDIRYRALSGQSSLQLLNEEDAEAIVVAWVRSLEIGHDRILSMHYPCNAK
jgi:hypothetical protein